MKKLVSVILMLSLGAFIIWLINTKEVQRILMFIFLPLLVILFGLVSYAIGSMLLDRYENVKKMHPVLGFLSRLLIGGFLLFSLFAIVRISGCKSVSNY